MLLSCIAWHSDVLSALDFGCSAALLESASFSSDLGFRLVGDA
jgi:hypothetical protein